MTESGTEGVTKYLVYNHGTLQPREEGREEEDGGECLFKMDQITILM